MGKPLYPIQLRNDQHAALNQTEHFSQPHQLLTNSNSTYSNEVNPGVSNRNEVISRRHRENHLQSDRSQSQRETEQHLAHNHSKFRSQSLQIKTGKIKMYTMTRTDGFSISR